MLQLAVAMSMAALSAAPLVTTTQDEFGRGPVAVDADGRRAYVVERLAGGRSLLHRSDDGGRSWYPRKDLGRDQVVAMDLVGGRLRLTKHDGDVLDLMDTVPARADGVDAAAQLPPEQRLRTVAGQVASPDFDTAGIAVLHDDGTFIARNDTAGRRMQLTPLPAGGYDGRFVAPRGVTPFGEELGIGDDANVSRQLPFMFPFFSSAFQLMYVSDNGNLTFLPDSQSDAVESSDLLASGPPRIAVLWDDFASGRVYFDAQPDAATITWFQVSQFGGSDFNAFQVVLEPNGRITMEWDLNAVEDGLVGLSPGGAAGRFYTDLTRDAPISILPGAAVYEQFVPDEVQMPRVLRRFYQCHPDLFPQLAVWGGTGFSSNLAPGGLATHELVSNAVLGIGLPVFTNVEDFGSAGTLESYLNMNHLDAYPDDPMEVMRGSRSGLDVIAEQTGRRWSAYVRYDDGASFASPALLGDGAGHWNFFLDSAGSVLGGHDFRDDGGGIFTAVGATSVYGPLDQYLMGLRRSLDVPDFTLIANVFDPGMCGPVACTAADEPTVGVVVSGNPELVSMAQIEAIEGARVPGPNDSVVDFRQGWILLVPADTTVSSTDLDKLERYRSAWEGYFSAATEARGRMDASMVGSGTVATTVVGNHLHLARSATDVTLDWTAAAQSRRRYVVLGTADRTLLADTPTGIGSVAQVGTADEIERLVDPGAAVLSTQRPSTFFYEVFARDCLDQPIVQ